MKLGQVLIILSVLTFITAEPLQLFSATTVLGSSGTLSGSLLGGQTIYISGIGFPSDPSALKVLVGGFPCIIPADGLTSTTISCVTTSSNSVSDKTKQLIQVVSNQQVYTLAGYTYSYTNNQTPQLNQVFPQSDIGGALLNYYGIHRVTNQGDGLRNMGDFLGLYVGNTLCSMFDITQGSISYSSVSRVMCNQAPVQQAGKYNVSQHITVGWAQTYWAMQRPSLKAQYYHQTVLPAITSVSPNQGALSGQDIVIKGTGFSLKAQNMSVSVDGVNCAITSASSTQIGCRLAAKKSTNSAALESNSSSPLQNYIAGVGLKYWRYNTAGLSTQGINTFRAAVNSNSSQISLVASGFASTLHSKDIYGSSPYGQVFKGYFYAPVTGNYIFRGAADDQFQLYISLEYGTTGSNLTQQIYQNSGAASDYNYYISNITSALGTPRYFQAGKYYYLEAYHYNFGGAGYLKISVQVPNSDSALPRKRYEVNQIQTTFKNDHEIMQFSLNNAAGGTFNLTYYQVDNKTLQVLYNQVATINYNASCTQFQNALNNFVLYSGYGVICTGVQAYDATGAPATLSTGVYFTWTVNVSLLRPSTLTSASLTFAGNKLTPPPGKTATFSQTRLQAHCPLISGTFTLSVGGTPIKIWGSGSYSVTNIPYNVTSSTLRDGFRQIVGFEKAEVTMLGDPLYGATWVISYLQYTGDVPDLILSGAKLAGGKTGTTPQISFFQTRPYSTNVIFNPIDENFLFMPSSSPNVLITVNGIPSVCVSNCTYQFLVNTPEVTYQALSGSVVSINLSNPSAINYTTSQLTVTLDGQPCTITSGTFDSFHCQMPTNTDASPVIRAGVYNSSVLLDGVGLLHLQDTVQPINYGLTINSVTPNSGGTNGGYVISLIGNGYPSDPLEANITLCGSQVTITHIQNTLTNITVPQCASTGIQTITYQYNGYTATGQFNYTAPLASASIFYLYPQSASPVLKAVMTIVGQGFGNNIEQISVGLANASGLIYNMRVLSVNDTQIKCGIPGGLPGNYDVIVRKAGFGEISPVNSTANDFAYELAITSISPSTGAYYGGTLITITGINFAPNILQNLVYVSDSMNWLCSIKNLTTSSIQCRTPPTNPQWTNNTQGIIVGNRLIQDSTCPGNNCFFTYNDLDASPNLTSISLQLVNSGLGVVSLNGNNLNIIPTNQVVVVFLNNITGVETIVTPTNVTATKITFNVPSIEAGFYLVRARLDPYGQTNSQLLIVQNLVSKIAYTGSLMGGVVSLTARGLPSAYPFSSFFSFRMSSSNGINYDPVVKSTSPTTLQIVYPSGYINQTFTFVLANQYKQSYTITLTLTNSSTPSLSLVSTSILAPGIHTIELNCNNLPTINASAIYVYNVLAPQKNASISNWTYNGSHIIFSHNFDAGQYGVYVYFPDYGWANTTGILITVAASASYTASPVGTSYNGGQFVVSGANISPSSVIKVGGFVGNALSVNTTHAVFSIPPLVTPVTANTYPSLAVVQKIKPQTILSDLNTNNNNVYAFDEKDSTYYSSSSNSTCFIGIDIGEGKLANLQRIRYFPYYKWIITANYLTGGIFQGSTDGTNYVELAKVDQTVHAGWNSLLVNITQNYRYFRFSHNSISGCKLSGLQFFGVVYNNLPVTVANINNFATNAVFFDGYNTFTFTNAISYQTSLTPVVTNINPPTGSIYGSQIIQINGQNLNYASPSIIIDTVPCSVNASASNSTLITCTTGSRLFLPTENSFNVNVGGNVAIIQSGFEYVMRWSDIRTWGTDLPPVDGDLVYVPQGMTLYVDQDTPILDGIVVENGKLIFADQKDLTIRSNLITMNGGQFRAGTEDKPYQHKLTFIMYGSYWGKQQPMFGNKGIACLNCKFSMYGTPRPVTWTSIASTIDSGTKTLTVKDNVDWKVGQEIVIASTDFDHNQAEQKIITAISGKTITVDSAFKYQHFSGIQTYTNGDSLQISAEVGLLTRNIKMMGDPTSIQGEYGSHLMLTGSAQSGLVGHVAYSQFTKCGQARIIGRYCIHFHMAGDVADSYVLGNAVHHSFARVVTLHGVKFLRVAHNVGYYVKGHNFFIEDGIQTQNVLEYNLAISSLTSFNMLQTDISVASFWVTNPTNHLRHNHAAGGDFYGFWYEIKPNPDGPSATLDICPIGNPLGESHDNVAHSYVRFGLRIFKLYARQNPCNPIRNDGATDPWSANPSIQSVFYNYVMYKNGESALLAEQTGNTLFLNFTVAESVLSAAQFYVTNFTKQVVQARNWTVIGLTNMSPPSNLNKIKNSIGFIGPRSSGLKLSNIRVHNFPSTMTVLKTCSKCDDTLLFINTAAEYLVENFTYDNVSAKYIFMNGLKRQIVYDLDGTFTAPFNALTRTKGTLVYNFKHLAADSACTKASNSALWDNTLVCDASAQVRRVMFTNIINPVLFSRAPMKIQLISDVDEIVPENSTNFTEIYSVGSTGMQPMLSKTAAYAVAFIAGRTYNIWWLTGLDFIHLAMEVSTFFNDSDPAIIFKFNYTTHRELFEVATFYNWALQSNFTAQTFNRSLDHSSCGIGDYTHDVDNRTFTLCATSRNKMRLFQYTDVNAIYCRYLCPAPNPSGYIKEKFVRLWSNATQWPGGYVPKDYEDVLIPGEWTILVDIQPSIIGYWVIRGDVIVPDSNLYVHFKANNIWIQSGSLQAGISSAYHPGKVIIEIYGNKTDLGIVIDPQVAGNKMFGVTGTLQLYGQVPGTTWTKLTSMARPGDTTITVLQANDWKIGDQIGIAPSFRATNEFQQVTITAINGTTISFTPPLKYKHYGDLNSTIVNSVGTLDTRAAVGHLTRNIQIIAGNDSGWGYNLLVYGFVDTSNGNVTLRTGNVLLYGVQFINGGQYDTQNAALDILNTVGTGSIQISGSTFHDCAGYCLDINNINNANIKNNVFFKGRVFLVQANSLSQFIFQNNLMIGAQKRTTIPYQELVACFATYYSIHNVTASIKHNLCQGSDLHGFVLPYVPCSFLSQVPYDDNTVGSAQIGHIFNKVPGSCMGANGIKAYACKIGHIASSPSTTQIIYQNFMVADSGRGVTLRFGQEGDDNTAYFKNSYVSAISRPNCSQCYGNDTIPCTGGQGIRMLAVTVNGQVLPSKFGAGFDVICKQQSFDAKAFLDNITFENFNIQYGQLPQCGNNAVFQPHSSASDLTGSHHLNNIICNNCSVDALAKFTPPNPSDLGWFGGCGSILCTGKNNYLITDYTGTFLGFPGFLLANNSVIGDNTQNCTFNSYMNGHICRRLDFGVIEYESIAPDFNTRIMWPVYLKFEGGNWNSTTNGWREWDWDGNQPLNHRLARFVSVVQLNKVYNMTFESEPPIDMRLQFQRRTLTGNSSQYIVIKLYYPQPNSIRIQVQGNTIAPLPVLDGKPKPSLNVSTCGSNIFYYQNYTIHFVLTAQMNCQVRVSLVNSIQLTAKFSMDINNFYTMDGQTLFIDRMCALLGIVDTSRLKIVGIYNGSVVIQAYIDELMNTTVSNSTANNNTAQKLDIKEIESKIKTLLSSGNLATEFTSVGLGPLLDLSAVGHYIYIDPTPTKKQTSLKLRIQLIVGLTVGIVTIVIAFIIGLVYIKKTSNRVVDTTIQPTELKIHETVTQTYGLEGTQEDK